MSQTIRISIVEDHPEFRDTVELVLGIQTDLEIVSQFGNAELALRSLKECEASSKLDILLLDLNLPGMTGLEAIPWFRTYAPHLKIIVLSQSEQEADVLEAIGCGAHGYLLKSTTLNALAGAIREVHRGGAVVEPQMAQYLLKTLRKDKSPVVENMTISEREHEVLTLIADGHSQKEIAERLEISVYTVTDHLKHIYMKLGVKNAPQAVAKGYTQGLLGEGN
ncbi:response regulator [Rubritalea spongiae]|uniref:Response regulator n=1 Tax=Rubritalea spongiae TaxID=430797 RepID=A0ABW5E5U1_9BACT